MRRIEIRNLWLRHEVLKGEVETLKIPGGENPADLMAKSLHMDVFNNHLHKLNLRSVKGNEVKKIAADGGAEEREGKAGGRQDAGQEGEGRQGQMGG